MNASHVLELRCKQLVPHCIRWCVTGTPVGAGGLDDVQFLLRILKHNPYRDRAIFRAHIQRPFSMGQHDTVWQKLHEVLTPLMWRTSKGAAAKDHPLPPLCLQVCGTPLKCHSSGRSNGPLLATPVEHLRENATMKRACDSCREGIGPILDLPLLVNLHPKVL